MLLETRFEIDAAADLSARNLDFRIHDTLATIDREAWDACFGADIERYDYLWAVEQAGLAGFEWRYATISYFGIVVAAAPIFLCDYHLETTLERGWLTALVEGIRKRIPGFLSLRLACIGSPCTECGTIGIHPDISVIWKADLLTNLLRWTERWAQRSGYGLFALKDVPAPLNQALSAAIQKQEFVAMPSLPTAWLRIDFPDIETYLARLSSATRKDMRRKCRVASEVKVERVNELGDMLPRFIELYQDTRNRSEWQFEELTSDYFKGVLENLPDNAFCTVYRVGDEILAFNLLLHDDDRLIDKFFCMDTERGRPYNLYYLSWFENLRYCLENGLTRYQSGQAYYENKLRLGSALTANVMYFKHRNAALHAVLSWVAPFFGSDGLKKQ
ncbi:GNAT family N-acetyltransferase [Rhizobium sp. AQ_MP]|uniref:GNAT family N-acetyltransferase n=1 Tax=Rhizobium sp. AQ_MP TaxID=2761536 RepID=UPI00163A7030|nr:GNAT family N-acetyltransferase [Rhizobium sp. AQ_MP]MBC2775121.1 GNAT family N-acetyltransferase [Rhizobium sp. AQ_MP]